MKNKKEEGGVVRKLSYISAHGYYRGWSISNFEFSN